MAGFAGSILGAGKSRARFGRAFAVPGGLRDASGSGAPTRRRGTLFAIAAFALLALLLQAGVAEAAKVRLSQGTFGSAAQPTFTKPLSVAVDQSTIGPSAGDVLVLDGGANEVQSLKVSATSGQFRLSY